MSNEGRELQWDDTIENDGTDFVLLEPGEYDFRVKAMEKKRHPGTPKLPPCNMATLHIDIAGETTLEHNLFLHSKTEGLVCAFFRSISARKHGEKLKMDWNKVIGATGRCLIENRKWTAKDGSEKQSNQIKKFLDPETEPETESDDIPF